MYHIKTTLQDHTGLQKERKTMQNQTKPHENYTKISQKLCTLTPFGAEINQAHIYITSGRGRENGVFMFMFYHSIID